jgi:hypothetical protein
MKLRSQDLRLLKAKRLLRSTAPHPLWIDTPLSHSTFGVGERIPGKEDALGGPHSFRGDVQ